MDVLHPPLHFLASPPLLPPHSLTNLIIHTFHSFESKMEMFSGSEKTPPPPAGGEGGHREGRQYEHRLPSAEQARGTGAIVDILQHLPSLNYSYLNFAICFLSFD